MLAVGIPAGRTQPSPLRPASWCVLFCPPDRDSRDCLAHTALIPRQKDSYKVFSLGQKHVRPHRVKNSSHARRRNVRRFEVICDGSHCCSIFQIIWLLPFIREPSHLLVLFQPPNSTTCHQFPQFHHLSPPPLIAQPHSRHHQPVCSFTSLNIPPPARTPSPAPPSNHTTCRALSCLHHLTTATHASHSSFTDLLKRCLI